MSKYKTITIKDTRESLAYAINEMYNALKKGGGVGLDLRAISPECQKEAMEVVDKQFNSFVGGGKNEVDNT